MRSWKVDYKYVSNTGRNEVATAVTEAPTITEAIEKVKSYVQKKISGKDVDVTAAELIGHVI